MCMCVCVWLLGYPHNCTAVQLHHIGGSKRVAQAQCNVARTDVHFGCNIASKQGTSRLCSSLVGIGAASWRVVLVAVSRMVPSALQR